MNETVTCKPTVTIKNKQNKNRAMCRNCCAATNIELLGLKFCTTFLGFTESQLSDPSVMTWDNIAKT